MRNEIGMMAISSFLNNAERVPFLFEDIYIFLYYHKRFIGILLVYVSRDIENRNAS